jgi:uncharacterized protein with PQ loop repeat
MRAVYDTFARLGDATIAALHQPVSLASSAVFAEGAVAATCAPETASLSIVNQILGWALLVGILAANVPQVLKIARLGTSGLSPLYVALTALSGLFLLDASFFGDFALFACCSSVWSGNFCLDKLLSLFQFAAAFVGQLVVFVLYMVKQGEDKFLTRIYAAVLVLVAAVLGIAGGALVKTDQQEGLYMFKYVLGIFNVISGIVLYAPQIRVVIINKSAGSLSLVTLTIQTFGNIVFIYFTMVEDLSNVQVYGPQIGQFALSLGLLILCVVYEVRQRRISRLTRQLGGLDDAFDGDPSLELEEATKLNDDFLDDEDF